MLHCPEGFANLKTFQVVAPACGFEALAELSDLQCSEDARRSLEGVCDVFDFLCFQNSFVGGCP